MGTSYDRKMFTLSGRNYVFSLVYRVIWCHIRFIVSPGTCRRICVWQSVCNALCNNSSFVPKVSNNETTILFPICPFRTSWSNGKQRTWFRCNRRRYHHYSQTEPSLHNLHFRRIDSSNNRIKEESCRNYFFCKSEVYLFIQILWEV